MTESEMQAHVLKAVSHTLAGIESNDPVAPGGELSLVMNGDDYFALKRHKTWGLVIGLADSVFDAFQDSYDPVVDGLPFDDAVALLRQCHSAIQQQQPLPRRLDGFRSQIAPMSL